MFSSTAITILLLAHVSCTLSASCGTTEVGVKNRINTTDSVNVTLINIYNSSITATTAHSIPPFGSINVTLEICDEMSNTFEVHVELNESNYFAHPAIQIPLNNTTRHIVVVYGNLDSLSAWVHQKSSKPSLGIDQALLKVKNHDTNSFLIKELSSDCYKCSPVTVATVHPSERVYVLINTKHKMTYQFKFVNEEQLICSVSDYFSEHSEVELSISSMHCSNMTTNDNGDNANLDILYVVIILVGSFVIWNCGMFIYQRAKKKGLLNWKRVERDIDKDLGNPDETNNSEKSGTVNNSDEHTSLLPNKVTDSINAFKSKRLKSLDALRGLSLVIMIFVNYGGGGYWFFSHSTWNGITVADLVFPWFVWIMGVSIVFSFQGRKEKSILSMLYQIVRRTIILFGLGLFLNNGFLAIPWFIDSIFKSILASFPNFRPSPFPCSIYRASLLVMWVGLWVCHGYQLSTWRLPGVLQRFAITYFVVAITELCTKPLYTKFKLKWSVTIFKDITSNWIQWVVVVLLEVIWLLLTFKLPVPGCPTGYLGPGGRAENGQFSNCTGGAAGYIDLKILTAAHIYGHPTCKSLYDTGSYDPEGILGSINSIVICFLGVQAGRIFVYHKKDVFRILRLVIWGVVLGALGTALCEGQLNEGFIPLNKNLWSLSFILVISGMGFILLALFYILIDVLPIWNGGPFIYPGMNSILVYVGSELLEGHFPFGWDGMKTSHIEYLISNVISVGLWTLIAYYWYTINFFVKI